MVNRNSTKEGIGKRIFFAALAIIFIDQATKLIFIGKDFPILNNIFHITYVQNTGSVFGALQGLNTALIFLTFVVLGMIIYFYDKMPWQYTALIIGGAVGNLIDRIRLGFVVDFLDFRIWPVFNIADSCITIAVIGLIIYIWRN